MTKPIFTWYPDEGASENIKPSVNVTKFGDGYEQRTAVGINNEVISWTLIFTGSNAQTTPIRDFLRARGALGSFQWTNPLNELGVYVCREFAMAKIASSIMQISVKFDRVYEANI
jgi:phage-related protein